MPSATSSSCVPRTPIRQMSPMYHKYTTTRGNGHCAAERLRHQLITAFSRQSLRTAICRAEHWKSGASVDHQSFSRAPPQVSTGGRHGALLVFCRRSAGLLRCITDRSLRALMADLTEAESPIAGSALCKPSHLCPLLLSIKSQRTRGTTE